MSQRVLRRQPGLPSAHRTTKRTRVTERVTWMMRAKHCSRRASIKKVSIRRASIEVILGGETWMKRRGQGVDEEDQEDEEERKK